MRIDTPPSRYLFLQTRETSTIQVAHQWLYQAWSLAAADQIVDLAFSGTSIHHLFQQKKNTSSSFKTYLQGLRAWELYDIRNVYYHQQALDSYQLNKDDLNIKATSISLNRWPTFLREYDHIISY